MATLEVELVAVDRMIWSGEASMVRARTVEGELGILPSHTPLLGQLADEGVVSIHTDSGVNSYDVDGGFISVSHSVVSILAESAEPVGSK